MTGSRFCSASLDANLTGDNVGWPGGTAIETGAAL